ncbi:MAG: DUF4956 domain-containing protein [Lachnospiraceae bacterium]|nr:DUF4956 domain-containing protein [Lachnospiraceae bacterium]
MDLLGIIRKAMFEGYAAEPLTPGVILFCICFTAVLGAYIFIVYRRINTTSFYNRSFNVSLVAIAVITAAIILTIQSNIVVSLGMVGALSIVRFRTAVKDPLDLVFLFWSISAGIICGAGFALIAMLASLVLTVIIIVCLNVKQGRNITLLVVNLTNYESEKIVMDIINNNCSYSKVRTQNADRQGMSMTVEVRIRERERLLHELMGSDIVSSVSFMDDMEGSL